MIWLLGTSILLTAIILLIRRSQREHQRLLEVVAAARLPDAHWKLVMSCMAAKNAAIEEEQREARNTASRAARIRRRDRERRVHAIKAARRGRSAKNQGARA